MTDQLDPNTPIEAQKRPDMASLGRSPRESTVESADAAEGIYSLYGDGVRGSWRDPVSNSKSNGRLAQSFGDGPHTPLRNSLTEADMEETGEGSTSSDQLDNGRSHSHPNIPNSSSEPSDGQWQMGNSISRSSTGTGSQIQSSLTPEIRLTPSKGQSGDADNHTVTPTHPSISRLSPRRPHPLGGSTTSTATTASSVSTGRLSSAGSSQYPGEEEDAFHVRSTYARLEALGVHGDGWEAGVERTRGGPSSASKRATVIEAERDRVVSEKEKEFLASLDRYGFVNEPLRNRNETRIALIPTAPLLKIPKLPKVSPLAGVAPQQPAMNGPSDHEPKAPDMPTGHHEQGDKDRRKERERVDKWMKMMKVTKRDQGGNILEWGWKMDGQGHKLPKRVYKGVPDRWRMAAWWTMAEEYANQEAKAKGKGKAKAENLVTDYRNSIDLPSSFDVQIDLDVPRTISGQTQFVTRYGAGQRSLFHVLHCFSMRCHTCEYVQGMGPIAATLLCYFEPERAFALLVRLHDSYGMHSIFAPGFPGLLETFYVQERLMESLMPELYQSFQRNMISSSAWGTKWYITLFVNTIPFSQQLRIWDALWLDGRDVMVLTSVAILWAFRDLLSAKTATFESILSLLSSYFVAQDEDALLRWIQKMLDQPGFRTRLDGWRTEWHKLVKEGKSDSALL